ncbi:MAG: hypothetical protein AB1523_07095 [Bacillota bacterium]
MKVDKRERILGGLFGVAAGDALGVAVDFRPGNSPRRQANAERLGCW